MTHDNRDRRIHPLKNVLDGLAYQCFDALTNKMRLVTREEFDIQKQVLLRTRLKLEAIEQELNNLLIKVSKYNKSLPVHTIKSKKISK